MVLRGPRTRLSGNPGPNLDHLLVRALCRVTLHAAAHARRFGRLTSGYVNPARALPIWGRTPPRHGAYPQLYCE
ncbi:protein of unknown function [Streptomyces murinus]